MIGIKMNWYQLIGLIAGGLTSVGMLAQILQIFITGESRDVSGPFFILFMLGVLLWLYYGLKCRDLVLIFWNTIGVFLCTLVLVLKFIYG